MTITSSSFLNNGRLGNIFFRYASLIGLAKKYGHELVLPEWEYSDYFENEFPTGHISGTLLRETEFHYDEKSWFCLFNKKRAFDIKGYLQSEKYWIDHKEDILKAFKFKSEHIERLKQGFDFSKKTIAIHIRKGDYSGNENYYQLPITYYFLALEQFKDWMECNIIIFSDDIEYCKVHFKCLPNVQFSEGLSPIEDICLGSQCDRFILSNSTFSWWMAHLSQSKEVIRPNYLFAGNLLANNSDKDFWPGEWQIFDHVNKKIDLSDVTFVIPVVFDHPDRMQNLKLCLFMLQNVFDTNIIIGEQKSQSFAELPCEYVFFEDMKQFHRTKMLNELFRQSKTNIVFNWDADVFISPVQIAQAVYLLRSGIEVVYPYDGTFARMPREQWFIKIKRSHDIGIAGNNQFKGSNNKVSLGGAVGLLRDQYLSIGGENENFISFGAEDLERKSRAEKLGLKVERVKGALYHMDHWIGVNSSTRNPYFKSNREEFYKVDKMNKEELREYIKSWE